MSAGLPGGADQGNASHLRIIEKVLDGLRREGVQNVHVNIYINNIYNNGVLAMVNWERLAIFVFGVIFVAVLLIIALFYPRPTPFQYTVFRIVLALAAAGVAALIPGLINVKVPGVSAGGALAVFVVVFFFSPAALVATPS